MLEFKNIPSILKVDILNHPYNDVFDIFFIIEHPGLLVKRQ